MTTLMHTTRLARPDLLRYADHRREYDPERVLVGSALLQAIADAGLTGRGGAGFPTARKLVAVASAGGRPVVVGNGAEGEPASSKDRALLAAVPHLVIDGLVLTAGVVGAARTVLYAPEDLLEYRLRPALAERADGNRVELVPAPDTFVAGQESAVVAAVEGRPAIPSGGADPVYRRGVGGAPTLVQNVETLAQIALVAYRGADWYASVGENGDTGTRLVTVSGAVAAPGVYEIPAGSTLGAVLAVAGGPAEHPSALLVGGYHGAWLPATEDVYALPMTATALAPFEGSPGAGVVVVLPARTCGLRATADLLAYLAGESAGQCGPCAFGLPALAHAFGALAGTRGNAGEAARIAGLLPGRGACRHPDGSARMARTALRTFADEVALHRTGRCSAQEGRIR